MVNGVNDLGVLIALLLKRSKPDEKDIFLGSDDIFFDISFQCLLIVDIETVPFVNSATVCCVTFFPC